MRVHTNNIIFSKCVSEFTINIAQCLLRNLFYSLKTFHILLANVSIISAAQQ